MGIFPPGARWYLASIAILSLLSVGAHLYIQDSAQKHAEQAIHNWAARSDVSIDDVRYHLLRNGLILRNLHIRRGSDSLTIDHILLRADPDLLTAEEPQVGTVSISGVQLVIHRQSGLELWRADLPLRRIWQAAHALDLNGGSLALHWSDTSKPLLIDQIELSQHRRGAGKAATLSARLNDAPLIAAWHSSEHQSDEGQLVWHNIDISALNRSMIAGPDSGLLSGEATWVQSSDELSLHGHAKLHAADTVSPEQNASLQWQGNLINQVWAVTINSNNWPLNNLSDFLPRIEEREVVSGALSGTLFWQHDPHSSILNSEAGSIHNLTYAPDDHSAKQPWLVQELRYRDMAFDADQKHLNAAQISLIKPQLQIAIAPLTEPEKLATAWLIHSDRVDVDSLQATIHLPEGNLQLESLDGSLSLQHDGLHDINLQSSVADGQESPEWVIQGYAALTGSRNASMKIRGSNVALTQLRSLLPLKGAADGTLLLDGKTTLQVMATRQQHAWQLSGDVVGENILLAHAGDRWMAEQLSIDFGPLGMGLPSQTVQTFKANNWHYIAALQPLPTYSLDAKPSLPSAFKPWWIENLSAENWQIDEINWQEGAISIGQPDSYWLTGAALTLKPLANHRPSALSLQGDMGGGAFSMQGRWHPFSTSGKFIGNIDLYHATPFFLTEWMQASNLGRPISGRISGHLKIADSNQKHRYRSNTKLQFHRLKVEQQMSANDAMVSRTGFNTVDLIRRLKDQHEQINISFPIHASWQEQPLNLSLLGTTLQQQIKSMTESNQTLPDQITQRALKTETRIRLRDSGSLSLNERTRLRKVVKKLQNSPELIVHLTPKWRGDSVSWDLQQRINYTHQLIEQFLNHRGISKQRIYPSQPTAQDRAGEIASVWVVLEAAE